MMKVGIFGATGYAGYELLRWLGRHPEAQIVFATSESQAGKKLYLIKAQTPVEVVVRLEGWFKVRDAEGTLAWIESRQVSERRTLVVTAPIAEIRQTDKPEAPVLAELEKWVAVEFLEPASPGWARSPTRSWVSSPRSARRSTRRSMR